MSDFYKYSTRYRKPAGHSSFEPPENIQNTSQTPQNKGVYQPLKPNSCNPIALPLVISTKYLFRFVKRKVVQNKLRVSEIFHRWRKQFVQLIHWNLTTNYV